MKWGVWNTTGIRAGDIVMVTNTASVHYLEHLKVLEVRPYDPGRDLGYLEGAGPVYVLDTPARLAYGLKEIALIMKGGERG